MLSLSNPPKVKIPNEKACTVSTDHWHGKSPKKASRVVKFLDMGHLARLVSFVFIDWSQASNSDFDSEIQSHTGFY